MLQSVLTLGNNMYPFNYQRCKFFQSIHPFDMRFGVIDISIQFKSILPGQKSLTMAEVLSS